MLKVFMEEKASQISWWKTVNVKTITLGVIAVLFLLLFLRYLFVPAPPEEQPQETKTNLVPSSAPPSNKKDRAPGQIVVKFKAGVTDAEITKSLQPLNAKIKSKIPGINATVIEVPVGQEDAVMTALSKEPIVKYAEPDFIQKVNYVPNDTYYKNQWGLVNTGQTIKNRVGKANADINVQTAWDVSKGAGIKVAVLDTGIDMAHPDLASKIVLQKVFATSTIDDKFGHGTHVAGIVAAKTNNGQGIAGTCPECQLIVGKVMGDDGQGLSSTVTTGIIWAADNGAKVINLSEGGSESSVAQSDAINYAWNKGIVVVAAAGNAGVNQKFYPAAMPNVLSVAATNNTDTKAFFSNYGTWVNVTAPGDAIFSTMPTHAYAMQTQISLALNYDYLSGTSMATPIVSGVAALVWASPQGTSADNVVKRIVDTADKITGTGQYWESGRVNAAKAVGTTPTPTIAPTLKPTATKGPNPTSVTDPSPSVITPTLFCLGSCPTPILTKVPTATTGPSSVPLTNTIAPTSAPSTVPTLEPCDSSSVAIQTNNHGKSKHKKSKGSKGDEGLLVKFLEFLKQLFELFKQLLEGGSPDVPGTPSTPTDPCPSVTPVE